MAKRQRNRQVTTSFHYLVKGIPDEDQDEGFREEGFTQREFGRVLARIRDITPLDESDDEVVSAIKRGTDLPFSYYDEIEPGLHFGDFDGAYYGQRYRNNRLGVVEADDLNMRGFHYLVTRLRDGKILSAPRIMVNSATMAASEVASPISCEASTRFYPKH